VKYEDLVNIPEAEVIEICKMSLKRFEEEMIASIEEDGEEVPSRVTFWTKK